MRIKFTITTDVGFLTIKEIIKPHSENFYERVSNFYSITIADFPEYDPILHCNQKQSRATYSL